MVENNHSAASLYKISMLNCFCSWSDKVTMSPKVILNVDSSFKGYLPKALFVLCHN